MQRLQAYKYELMPTGEQQRQMRRFAGSCRFVFNKALALQKECYEQGKKKLGYAGLCKLLTEWRNSTETAWLADAPVHPLQQTLKDLVASHVATRWLTFHDEPLAAPHRVIPAQAGIQACPQRTAG